MIAECQAISVTEHLWWTHHHMVCGCHREIEYFSPQKMALASAAILTFRTHFKFKRSQNNIIPI